MSIREETGTEGLGKCREKAVGSSVGRMTALCGEGSNPKKDLTNTLEGYIL